MVKSDALRFGPLSQNTVHICVDMQRMFAETTDWEVDWLPEVLPNIIAVTEQLPSRTIFTRFIPAERPGAGVGAWRRYYERWHMMTIQNLGLHLIDLVPELSRFVPPARVFDKHVYSPWTGSALHLDLQNSGVDSIIVTGGETDVCVLSTVLGAVDWGFRVILVTDAICGSADETHDATMEIYLNRFGEQVETVTTSTLLIALGRRR